MQEIENIELTYLNISDYKEFKTAMIASYSDMPDSYWREKSIAFLIDQFPEGQVFIKVNGELAGCALSIMVNYDDFEDHHTYSEITGEYTFDTHTNNGDVLYGIDVFIKPEFRGLRLARRVYQYRKELCEQMNLRGIAFGGRIPNYHNYMDTLSPKEYIDKVKRKEIHDSVLDFQISND